MVWAFQGEVHSRDVEIEIHHVVGHDVVGHDGVESPNVVSGYNFWCTGRNGGHHCGMIQ